MQSKYPGEKVIKKVFRVGSAPLKRAEFEPFWTIYAGFTGFFIVFTFRAKPCKPGLSAETGSKENTTDWQTARPGGYQSEHFDYDTRVCPVGLSSTVLKNICFLEIHHV
ncbi:MAG: hypothetical protein VB998_09835 [Pseudomonas sp.]